MKVIFFSFGRCADLCLSELIKVTCGAALSAISCPAQAPRKDAAAIANAVRKSKVDGNSKRKSKI